MENCCLNVIKARNYMWGTIKIDGLWMQNEPIQTCGEYDIKCTIIGWETPGCKNQLGELN